MLLITVWREHTGLLCTCTHRMLPPCSLSGPPSYPEVASSMQEPINEIKVSISQLRHNNSEGRRLEAECTSAKFISSGPGACIWHTSLSGPEPLHKADRLTNSVYRWISFWINNFLSWVFFFFFFYSGCKDAVFLLQYGFREFYNLVIKIFDRL